MERQKRIFTVRGITDNLRAHSRRYGISYATVYYRLLNQSWTIEQALGIDPPPPPKLREDCHGAHCLIPIDEILGLVISGQIDAERYLQLEGVSKNAHPLRTENFADDESSDDDDGDGCDADSPTAT
jgi:hypothetical protein